VNKSRWPPPTFLYMVISVSEVRPRGVPCRGQRDRPRCVAADQTACQRLADLPGPLATNARVDEDPASPPDNVVVGLAHVRQIGADQIDMSARFQQDAAYRRLGRHRHAGDDVCLRQGVRDILQGQDVGCSMLQPGGQRRRLVMVAIPNENAADGRRTARCASMTWGRDLRSPPPAKPRRPFSRADRRPRQNRPPSCERLAPRRPPPVAAHRSCR